MLCGLCNVCTNMPYHLQHVCIVEVKSEAPVTKDDPESPIDAGYTLDTLLLSTTPATKTTTMTTTYKVHSPDAPNNQETLHLLLRRLQEKRRDAARPDDLSVSGQNITATSSFYTMIKLVVVLLMCDVITRG